MCENNPEFVCQQEYEILPGYETYIESPFTIHGNIYNNKKLPKELSGIDDFASYFNLPSLNIGSIPIMIMTCHKL